MSSEIEPVTDFVRLMDKWKVDHQNEGYDLLSFLTRCSEILESALVDFHLRNPDPLDQRHPKLVIPECRLGKVLTLLENCKEFNDTMTSTYLKTKDSPKNVGRVVIASAKLALLTGKGYRMTGLDTEECVNVLISWIIDANEPLRTYATGLINGHCVVKKFGKDKSIELITTLLRRLWHYLEPDTYKEAERIVFDENRNKSNPRKRKQSSNFISQIDCKFVVRDVDTTGKTCVNNLYNSSCLEQMPWMLDVSCSLENSLTASLSKCYTFHSLKCFGESEEFLSTFNECNALSLISRYLEMKSEDRVVYMVLEFLSTLIRHAKAAINFIASDGIQKLIDIQKPSMCSTAVALCLYNLAGHKEAMEKIFHSQSCILRELVKFGLWLLDCSHDSGKSYIAQFFSVAFSCQNVLSLFDDMNGLRYLVNMISTTNYIIRTADDEYDPREDPDMPHTTTHIIKPACAALSIYFEAQVVFKVGQLVKFCPSLKRKYPSIEFVTIYEFATHTRDLHYEYFEILRELSDECENFSLESWMPIALFQRLDGVPLLLKIITDTGELAVTIPAQVKVCQAALDVLCAVTLSRSCQMTLTKTYTNLGVHVIGIHLILNYIEGHIHFTEVTCTDGVCLNSAIAVIANCTGGTCAKSWHDNESFKAHDPPRNNKMKRDVETLCKLIRQADGMKTLIFFLWVTKPVQTADETRYFACKALLGLVEYHQPVRQILAKLNALTSQLLPVIQEPVLKDKKQLNVKFYQNLTLLLERIVKVKVLTLEDDLKTALRTDVVPETRARYDNEDVLLMIYIYLVSLGFGDNTRRLAQGSEIFSDDDNNLFATSNSVRKYETRIGFVTENSKFSESNYSAHQVTLNSITDEHLIKNQHSKRGNTVVAVPPFPLLTHHHCPKRRNKIEASVNIQKRHCHQQGVYPKWGGIGGMGHYLRMIYSRFRNAGVIRPTNDRGSHFTAVAFDHNADCGLILGDSAGNLHFHKASKFEDRFKMGVFESTITYIEPSNAGDVMLLLSSNCWWHHNCALFAMDDTLDKKLTFEGIDFVEFSKSVQDKIVASRVAQAIIYDVNTGTAINTYGKYADDYFYSEDKLGCYYERNRATFSYDDRLVLSNGCLWDVRKSQTLPVHRFDQFSDTISGVFHPNGLEVIINTEVWDMRNYELIRTIPTLDQCQLVFNRSRNVMYAMKIDTEERPGLMSAISTFDASNYKQLGSISAEQEVDALALDDCDRNIATIEKSSDWSMSVCRMYEVGMVLEDDE